MEASTIALQDARKMQDSISTLHLCAFFILNLSLFDNSYTINIIRKGCISYIMD